MKKHQFTLKAEFIELNALLKYLSIAQTGGHAKMLIDEGSVFVNGVQEGRRRYKVRQGDEINVGDEHLITVS